jgi:hypothetical protein
MMLPNRYPLDVKDVVAAYDSKKFVGHPPNIYCGECLFGRCHKCEGEPCCCKSCRFKRKMAAIRKIVEAEK